MVIHLRLRFFLGSLVLVMFLLMQGCAIGASDLKPSEVSKDDGIFFGHIDFYDGDRRILENGNLQRCFVSFEDEEGSTIVKVKMDEASWIFAAAPAGRVYLSYVTCNVAFLGSHPELNSRDLYFPVAAGLYNYFGHLVVRFPRHGANLGGALFGAVGAGIQALSSTTGANKIEVENHFPEAQAEFVKRYGAVTSPKKFKNLPIQLPEPLPSPTPT